MKKILCIIISAMVMISASVVFAEETGQNDASVQSVQPENEGMRQRPQGGGGMRGARGEMGGMQPPGMIENNSEMPSGETTDEVAAQNENMPWGGGRPDFGEMPFENNQDMVAQEQSTGNIVVNHFTLIATVAALIFGFIFVIFYKR